MTEDSEIKDLLGRALGGQEPPLRLDRDEVFRAGRKRLRRRRAFEAGGAVAAVVAVVVGAATLTGMVGDSGDTPERMPPAASSTREEPSSGVPVSTITELDPPYSESPAPPKPGKAEKLSVRLAEHLAKALPYGKTIALSGAVEPAFLVEAGTYQYGADLVVDGHEGGLSVTIAAAAPGENLSCENPPFPIKTCRSQFMDGMDVVVGTTSGADGEKRNVVATVDQGTKIVVISSNHSTRDQLSGRPPSATYPVLEDKQLLQIIQLPDLRY